MWLYLTQFSKIPRLQFFLSPCKKLASKVNSRVLICQLWITKNARVKILGFIFAKITCVSWNGIITLADVKDIDRIVCYFDYAHTYAHVRVSRQVLRYLFNLITMPRIIWYNKVHIVYLALPRGRFISRWCLFRSSSRGNIDSGQRKRNLRILKSLETSFAKRGVITRRINSKVSPAENYRS